MAAPHSMAVVGALHGIQIWDWSDPKVRADACRISPLLCEVDLRFDEMYISYSTQSLLVGDQGYFLWRLMEKAASEECRAAAREHIREAAERILGEPWKLADEE